MSAGACVVLGKPAPLFIAHLDRWTSAAGVAVGRLSGPMIERYLAERRAAGYREYLSPRAFAPLLAYLGPLGVLPAPAVVRRGPVKDLLGPYRVTLSQGHATGPDTDSAGSTEQTPSRDRLTRRR